jgi:hypothetical protein
MKWAFVDLENIGCLANVTLSNYHKVIVFAGAKQNRLDFGENKYPSPLNLVVIQIKAIQANNLDFHLAYYLGKFDHEATPDIQFEVISNDNGFAPLVAHIKANGRHCVQVKTANPKVAAPVIPAIKTQPPAVISKAEKVIEFQSKLLAQPQQKRPKKVISLKNYIASHLRIQGNEVAIQNHLNQLVKAKIVAVSGDSVVYKR